MKTIFKLTRSCALLSLLLFACAAPPKTNIPHTAAQLEHDAESLSEHTESIQAYNEWLQKTNELLADQQEELEELIASTERRPQTSILAAEQQYRLLVDMTNMNMLALQFQSSAHRANEYYNLMSNMIQAQSEAAKDAAKNMK